ncbi:MAG: hypothetical protein Q8K32_02755 [Archangium sp.]|nr:hypothetical protein [Archangium sp.]
MTIRAARVEDAALLASAERGLFRSMTGRAISSPSSAGMTWAPE